MSLEQLTPLIQPTLNIIAGIGGTVFRWLVQYRRDGKFPEKPVDALVEIGIGGGAAYFGILVLGFFGIIFAEGLPMQFMAASLGYNGIDVLENIFKKKVPVIPLVTP